MTIFDKCQVYNDTLTVKKGNRLLGIEVVYKILRMRWFEQNLERQYCSFMNTKTKAHRVK